MGEAEKVGARLKTVREALNMSQREMSRRLGLGPNAWQIWESGKNIPTGEKLLRIADFGFNPGWILTGRGPMHLDQLAEGDQTGLEAASNRASNASDPELLARINDTINQVYRDEGGRISPADIGRIAADKYAAILNASDDQAERLVMVKLFETELRQQVRASAPGNAKASA